MYVCLPQLFLVIVNFLVHEFPFMLAQIRGILYYLTCTESDFVVLKWSEYGR